MYNSKQWAQKATDKMKKKGTVGSFTKEAHAAGEESPLSYADKVMANPGKYSKKTVKKANFAKNINS